VTDLGCRDGRIGEIGAISDRPVTRVVACGGGVVTPGLVESHIHLDKALLSERAPSVEGTLAEAIRVTGEAKRRFTVEDIRERARAVLDMAVRHGTTAMRSHVEVDQIVGLKGLEALLPLEVEYAPALDFQLCAFAQEGILQAPGTEALLEDALRRGADLVGGCPYNDSDAHPRSTSSSGWPRRSTWTPTSTPTSSTSRSTCTCATSPSKPSATGGRGGWPSAT
jgi:cytosine deaminase